MRLSADYAAGDVMMPAMTASQPHGLTQLRDALREFAAARDWDQFHSPKNLAAALAVEAAELLERFQWLTEDESRRLPPAELEKVRQEMADVLNYLVRLADKLDVNLIEAARDKIALNEQKYPADKVRGTARKYSEL
jgi:dCTP diphosphatase